MSPLRMIRPHLRRDKVCKGPYPAYFIPNRLYWEVVLKSPAYIPLLPAGMGRARGGRGAPLLQI